jgi:hypothetical protein
MCVKMRDSAKLRRGEGKREPEIKKRPKPEYVTAEPPHALSATLL